MGALFIGPEIQCLPLRSSIIKNVEKMIQCAKHELGYDLFQCPQCLNTSFVYHTCKSRFCSSCGVKYMNERANAALERCFHVPHRHITFTIDASLRDYFRKDRSLLNLLFVAVSETLFSIFDSMGKKSDTLTPGFMLTLHTFGRDLKWNPHIHALVSEGGITQDKKYKPITYISFVSLRKRFMKILFDKLVDHFGPSFKKVKNKSYEEHENGFYVNALENESRDLEQAVTYIVRYTGRPVMTQSRIEAYIPEEDSVLWHYMDHETEEKVDMLDSAISFMKKLILHIPDEQFKMIRYYGAYAAKNHKYRKLVRHITLKKKSIKSKLLANLSKYRQAMMLQFNRDPLRCRCGCEMEFVESYTPG